MSLLGPDLDKYVTKNRKSLTYEAVLELVIQFLCRVKALYDHSFIRSDLKPRQFLLDHVLSVSLYILVNPESTFIENLYIYRIT